jgi:hypothetical protein
MRIQGQGEAEELLMRSKEDENWRCSTWNSKSYLCLSAAMFHVERLLRCYNLSREAENEEINLDFNNRNTFSVSPPYIGANSYNKIQEEYDVIVVGAGHAGSEAGSCC